MIPALTILFMLIAVFLVLVILVQRGRGGGLSGAFGSGGGSSSAFGTKTGDVFTTVTVVLFVVFMLLAVWLNQKFQPATAASTTAPAIVPAKSASTPPASIPLIPATQAESRPTTRPASTAPTTQPR
jgi:preprotein translocase subunit SecG